MVDSKISALPAVAVPAATDELPVNQSGTTRKVTFDQLPDGVRKVVTSTVPVFDGEERTLTDRLALSGTGRLVLTGTGRHILESRIYVPGYIEATRGYTTDLVPIHQSGVTKRLSIYAMQSSRVLYVAPNGNDSTGTGSMMSPLATLQKAVGTVGTDAPLAPGDKVFVRGGTFSAHPICYIGRHDSGVDFNDALGTADRPIEIRAYPGETPLFTGNAPGIDPPLLTITRATYLTVDGLSIQHRAGVQAGIISVGQWPANGPWGGADNITIRNCTIRLAAGEGDSGYHAVYATVGTHNLVVESCLFIGPGNQTVNDGGYGVQVYEGFRDAPHNSIVRYCVFDGWNVGGVTFFGGTESPNPDGQIAHNTFKNCRVNIRLASHEQAYVHDNFGEEAWGDISYNILDDNPAKTTAFNNVWLAAGAKMGSFPAYNALSGSAAVGGASDGSIAGATQSSLAASQGWDTLGTQRKATRNFVIPGDYAHDVIGRLEMYGSLRGAIQGTGELILSDDFKTRGRVVLAGRGG